MEGTCGKSSDIVGGDSHIDTARCGMGRSQAKQMKQKAQHRQPKTSYISHSNQLGGCNGWNEMRDQLRLVVFFFLSKQQFYSM